MQLITRCFTFYFVLLFLWESSVALDLDNKLNDCEKALDDLFRLVAANSAGGTPDDFLFIPDRTLITGFHSKLIPEPKVEGKLGRAPNEKVIVNKVKLYSDHTIEFDVKQPDEGIDPDITKRSRGKFRIVCQGIPCKLALRAVWDYSTWSLHNEQLTCLEGRDGPFISGSLAKGVEVKLPWNQRYVVFNAKTTLTSLMNRQLVTVPHRWIATSAYINYPNSIKYYSASDRTAVDIPVPELANKVVEEYVQAAIDFLIDDHPSRWVAKAAVIKDRAGHGILFHKIPSNMFPAVPNAGFPILDAIPKTIQNIRQEKLAPI